MNVFITFSFERKCKIRISHVSTTQVHADPNYHRQLIEAFKFCFILFNVFNMNRANQVSKFGFEKNSCVRRNASNAAERWACPSLPADQLIFISHAKRLEKNYCEYLSVRRYEVRWITDNFIYCDYLSIEWKRKTHRHIFSSLMLSTRISIDRIVPHNTHLSEQKAMATRTIDCERRIRWCVWRLIWFTQTGLIFHESSSIQISYHLVYLSISLLSNLFHAILLSHSYRIG